MKRWLRSYPRVYDWYRSHLVADGPGAWLFYQSKLEWLYRGELAAELPIHLRLFAAYCRAQRLLHFPGHVIGGRWLFQRLAQVGQAISPERSVRLSIDRYVIHLDAYDPRLLQIPHEFAPSAQHAAVLDRFLSPGDTFLDVGANHGSLSVLAAHRVGRSGRVVAIEPQARLAKLIERSLAHNDRAPFEVHAVGVGDADGEVDFYVPRDTSGSAGVFRAFSATGAHERRTIQVRTLDGLCDWRAFPGKILMKLDVEGSELKVLRGAGQLRGARRPVILMELNDAAMRAAGVDRAALIAELAPHHDRYAPATDLQRSSPIADLARERARNVVILPTAGPG